MSFLRLEDIVIIYKFYIKSWTVNCWLHSPEGLWSQLSFKKQISKNFRNLPLRTFIKILRKHYYHNKSIISTVSSIITAEASTLILLGVNLSTFSINFPKTVIAFSLSPPAISLCTLFKCAIKK